MNEIQPIGPLTLSTASDGDTSADAAFLAHAGPILINGLDYWRSRCAGTEMPARRDIQPDEIRHILGHVVMVDVLRDPMDFVERITGATVQHHNSRCYTGIPWREVDTRGPDSEIWNFMRTVTEARTPRYTKIPYIGPHRSFLRAEVLGCPLSGDDKAQVAKILCFVDYHSL
ncbi:PAS domain-containing protein [Rhodospirillaceae bacterium KN72]|uniref:PAS domain-containing protein n=1 Tax=Pacificispira spongiicola TaxID=2729598 RepID=A0A7Y0E0W1_9PROT|nr:PAS domain-containing protein [Pacificispira spongiicola]NMM44416.1 PAS domain-containing protein [Pacificispira spongiicola]